MGTVTLMLWLALLWPAQPMPPMPPPPPATWESIPDLVAYVVLRIPQCDDCNGPEYNVGLEPKPAPTITWTDPGTPFRWLAWAIEDIMRRVICWILTFGQALANSAQLVANSFIFGINQAWRFAVFVWLNLRTAVLILIWLWELMRDFWHMLEQLAVLIHVWLQTLWELLVVALLLVGQLLIVFGQTLAGLIGMLGYIIGLVLGGITTIIVAIGGTDAPAQLAADNHPVYSLIRGFGEGLRDSPIGWTLYLAWGFVYVQFIVWITQYLPAAGREE